jgi:hypothetical protein
MNSLTLILAKSTSSQYPGFAYHQNISITVNNLTHDEPPHVSTYVFDVLIFEIRQLVHNNKPSKKDYSHNILISHQCICNINKNLIYHYYLLRSSSWCIARFPWDTRTRSTHRGRFLVIACGTIWRNKGLISCYITRTRSTHIVCSCVFM